ncbi:DNA primase DnaG [Candidatus Aenigmatarchaeota archaeon]
MSKLAPTSIKYMIKAHIKAKGVVEKPDIIGAVFGQTEGLLGSELDLRELQRTGRIGRIEVNIKSSKGSSEGEIIIPSSLDSAETALIAATLETIERVGPCTAEIKLLSVEDTRSEKRKFVVDKAKEILKELTESGVPDTSEISEQIKEAVRTEEISSFNGLPCGPSMMDSDEIVVVEGRADIINLLRYGIRNTLAIEGTSVPPALKDLSKKKSLTIFTDGDRGGKLIAKEIMQIADVDFVATAPEGKEVEELTKKEAYKALREKISASQFKSDSRSGPRRGPVAKKETEHKDEIKVEVTDLENNNKVFNKNTERPSSSGSGRSFDSRSRSTSSGYPGRSTGRSGPSGRSFGRTSERSDGRSDGRSSFSRSSGRDSGRPPGRSGFGSRMGGRMDRPPASKPMLRIEERELFKKTLDELVGTRAACIFNNRCELLGKVPVTELGSTLRTMDDPYAVVFDGRVDSTLNDVAKYKGVSFLIGMEKDRFPTPVAVLEKKDL